MTVLRTRLEAEAQRLGFLACGVAPLGPNPYGEALEAWLKAGYGGTMTWLGRQKKKRKDTRLADAAAKVAVVLLDRYHDGVTDPSAAGPPHRPRIARYARGRDYHEVVGRRLESLAGFLRSSGAGHTRCYVDTGPVPERELARRAGLGWIGKNTMLIRPGVGSWFFIAVILTDLDLAPGQEFTADHCGSCTRCLDACPTGAFVADRVLDATKCLSYQTIEWKKEISGELAARAEGWAFGCDICNEVCPWNARFAEGPVDPELRDHGWIPADAGPRFFEEMSDAEFDRRFGPTPLHRTGLTLMRRNWAMAWASLGGRAGGV
ncbi:MAG TPA: tRNA epoxyqueuosine(34) reductase QueG [Gemmatimonadales bacterium]|nr:tRNA epoxyqueuosine(34) reductase QueG [Gemmatimonadales bacterium]